MVIGTRVRVGVERADQLLDQSTFGACIMARARLHDRVAAGERVPGGVVIAEVVEFLVEREFERGTVLAAGRDLRQSRTDEIDVVGLRGLLADARQRQRGAAEGRARAQAGFHRRFRFGDAAVELQLQRQEITEVRRVHPRIARMLHAAQRLRIQPKSLVKVAQRELLRCIPRLRQRRMPHAIQGGMGFADAAQAVGDAQDEVRIRRQGIGGARQLHAGITQAILRQQHAGEQGAGAGMARLVCEQRLEGLARGLQPAGGRVLLGLQPQRVSVSVHARGDWRDAAR